MSNSPDDPRLIPGHPEFVQRPATWEKTVAKQICEIRRLRDALELCAKHADFSQCPPEVEEAVDAAIRRGFTAVQPTVTATPSDLAPMSNDELLELYQQISSRVGMYNTEVLIQRMFEIRKELNRRMSELAEAKALTVRQLFTIQELRARVEKLKADKARLDWVVENAYGLTERAARSANDAAKSQP